MVLVDGCWPGTFAVKDNYVCTKETVVDSGCVVLRNVVGRQKVVDEDEEDRAGRRTERVKDQSSEKATRNNNNSSCSGAAKVDFSIGRRCSGGTRSRSKHIIPSSHVPRLASSQDKKTLQRILPVGWFGPNTNGLVRFRTPGHRPARPRRRHDRAQPGTAFHPLTSTQPPRAESANCYLRQSNAIPNAWIDRDEVRVLGKLVHVNW